MKNEMLGVEISQSPQGGLVQKEQSSKLNGAAFETHQKQQFDLRNNLQEYEPSCSRSKKPLQIHGPISKKQLKHFDYFGFGFLIFLFSSFFCKIPEFLFFGCFVSFVVSPEEERSSSRNIGFLIFYFWSVTSQFPIQKMFIPSNLYLKLRNFQGN